MLRPDVGVPEPLCLLGRQDKDPLQSRGELRVLHLPLHPGDVVLDVLDHVVGLELHPLEQGLDDLRVKERKEEVFGVDEVASPLRRFLRGAGQGIPGRFGEPVRDVHRFPPRTTFRPRLARLGEEILEEIPQHPAEQ